MSILRPVRDVRFGLQALVLMGCWFAADATARSHAVPNAHRDDTAVSGIHGDHQSVRVDTATLAHSQAGMDEAIPAQVIANLYQVASHSTGLALQNAVHSQQALNQISSAVVSKAVALIMEVGA